MGENLTTGHNSNIWLAPLILMTVLVLSQLVAAIPANAAVHETWASLGPRGNSLRDDTADRRLGGQVNAIAVDPTPGSGIIYIGVSEGGIWQTADGGVNWNPVSDLALVRNSYYYGIKGTQSIGALAIDPSNHNIVYAGTGNPNVSCGVCGNHPGLGVFRSDDGGASWHPTGANLGSGDNQTMSFSTVYKIIVRKGSGVGIHHIPNTVIAATDYGLFQYADNGSDLWTRIGGSFPFTTVTDLVQSSSRIYAAVYGVGIFREKPGGHLEFEPLNTNGLPPAVATDSTRLGRIALAISRSKDQVLYAGFEMIPQLPGSDGNIPPHFYGIWKTVGAGDSWSALPTVPCGGPGSDCTRPADPQLDFNNAIAVDPTNPNFVYIGQIDFWRATDGGKSGSWEKIGLPLIHADFHDIAFDPGDSGVLYVANDGGVYKGIRTVFGGITWEAPTKNLSLGQCNTVGQAPFNPDSVICGFWNNGNAITRDRGETWVNLGGGDGFQAQIDAESLNGGTTAYADCNAGLGGAICRHQMGGTGFSVHPEVTINEEIWSDEKSLAFWSNPYIGGELLQVIDGKLFITESADRQRAIELSCSYSEPPCPWRPFGPTGKSGNITTVAFGNPIERVYYVGTDTGEVWYGTEDFKPIAGDFVHWEMTACSSSGKVNKIAADPHNPNRAFAVFGRVTGPGRVKMCDRVGINNWSGQTTDDSFNPEVQVDYLTSVAVDPSVADTIYVGTDQGIYKGILSPGKFGVGGGWSWSRSPGVSHVWVGDLAVHDSIQGPSGVIWASTYGRGVYTRDWLTHITAPVAVSVQAVEIGTVGRGEDLPSVGTAISLSAATTAESAQAPFYRNFATGSRISLTAPTQIQLGTASQIEGATASQVQIGGETLRFVGWEVSRQSSRTDENGGSAATEPRIMHKHSEATIRLTLSGQTTAVAKYERVGSQVKTLRVEALLDDVEEATAPFRVDMSATTPLETGNRQSPFAVIAPPNGQVVLTAPTTIVDDGRYLRFFTWVVGNQEVGSEATLSLKLDDNKTAFAIYRQVTALPR